MITDVQKDAAARTMTIVAEYDASIEAVWDLWADPRKLERWWGPPTYPATVSEHNLTPGGDVKYAMTGPEGDQHGGWWRVLEVDAPTGLVFEDGFARNDGTVNESMPKTMTRVTIAELDSERTRMTIASQFESAEAMQQLLDMGMDQGMQEAMSQIDGILAEAVQRS